MLNHNQEFFEIRVYQSGASSREEKAKNKNLYLLNRTGS